MSFIRSSAWGRICASLPEGGGTRAGWGKADDEVLDAIESGSPTALCEELGDFLFEAVFLAQISAEQGTFTITDAINGICEKLVRRHRGRPDFDIEKVGFDDAATFALLNEAKTVGVFQLESGGMQSLCRQFNITAIDEIVALIALYRPGPMAHIPRFVRCKHGLEKIEYPHPWLAELLSETYGVIVVQEQVMRVARDLAGFSLAKADEMRRAMKELGEAWP